MSNKNAIVEVLKKKRFTSIEVKGFNACIEAVKEAQKNDLLDPEEKMKKIIEEVINDEIQ